MSIGIDIRDFGGLVNGVADDAAAWTAAIAAASAGDMVVMPGGTSLVTTPIVVPSHGIVVQGAGPNASILKFATALAGQTLLTFYHPTELLQDCGLREIGLSSGSAYDVNKTALHIHDTRNFCMRNVKIKPWLGGGDTGGRGILWQGRDAFSCEKLYIEAGNPIHFALNDDRDPLTDLDHANFRDCYLQSTVAPNPVITFDEGYLQRHLMFTGSQNWIHGGLEWMDGLTIPRRDDKRDHLFVENLRIEQVSSPTSDTCAIRIELRPGYELEELRVSYSLLGAVGANWIGVRHIGVSQTVIDQCAYHGNEVAAEGTGNLVLRDSPFLGG